MPISVDWSQVVAACAGAAVGAIFTAFFSYRREKRRERLEHRKLLVGRFFPELSRLLSFRAQERLSADEVDSLWRKCVENSRLAAFLDEFAGQRMSRSSDGIRHRAVEDYVQALKESFETPGNPEDLEELRIKAIDHLNYWLSSGRGEVRKARK